MICALFRISRIYPDDYTLSLMAMATSSKSGRLTPALR